MIDFKYHLVSLVSVFMALAIGIVLGAGPLQDQIGVTLNNQVEALRADKERLNSEVVQARSEVDYRDQLLEALSPAILNDRLNGRRVVMLRLPDSPDGAVTGTEQDLQRAGATVSGRVTLKEAWVDPDAAQTRADAAVAIATAVAGNRPTADEVGDYLDRQLTDAIVVPSGGESATQSLHGSQVLDVLRDADLISLEGAPQQRATMIAAIAGSRAIDAKDAGQDAETLADAEQRYLQVLQTLRSRGLAAVLAAPESTDQTTSLLAALRRDDGARLSVSGVGGIDTATGPIVTVLAMAEQIAGGAGQYGNGPDAQAPLPQAPTPEPAGTP